MSNECKYEINTKHGDLLIVDEPLNYEESKQVCESLSSVLAPMDNAEIIQEISSHLTPCNATAYHGNIFTRSRDVMKWTGGLETYRNKGKWSNGVEYNDTLHDNLFMEGADPVYSLTCKTAYLEPTKKLLAFDSCSDERPFVCMRLPVAPEEIEDRTTHLFIIGLAMICIVLFLFHLLRFGKRMAKGGMKLTHGTVRHSVDDIEREALGA